MSEAFGLDFVSVTDDDGNEFELEHLGTLSYKGTTYLSFLPADLDEDDPDFGMILLKVVEENGEQLLADIDDEQELEQVYDQFLQQMFDEQDEDGDE